LRRKAADRNKDEFYFGMVNQRTEGGVHVQNRGNVSLPVDMVKILKSQDENYVRTMRNANMKKIDNIKSQLSAMADLLKPVEGEDEDGLDEDEFKILQDAGMVFKSSAKSKGKARQMEVKHIVFVDNADQGREYKIPSRVLDEAKATGGPERSTEDLGWKEPETSKRRKKRKSRSTTQAPEIDLESRQEEAKKHRVHLLKELSARLERDTQMRYAERELEMQKLLMGKGGSIKLRGVEEVKDGDGQNKKYKPRVYKWRAERKR